jgi:hypothetical protein
MEQPPPDPQRSAPAGLPAEPEPPRERSHPRRGMLPGRERRRFGLERAFMRIVATAGIVGIGVALGAILVSSDVTGWIVGLVVALTSVILAALLWSSRQL